MLNEAARSINCQLEEFEPWLPNFYSDSLLAAETMRIAKDILAEVLNHRRFSGPKSACATSPCSICAEPHLEKVASAVAQGIPVTFVLPAFPGKSPNPAKVLGPLPDMAERCALHFLARLCDQIKRIYSPGAKIILCSDGRVFNDIVGILDEDVTAYQREIEKMILELNLASISTFNLDEIFEGQGYEQMRSQLMDQYGEPIEALKASVSRGGKIDQASIDDRELHRLYCGITRFLLEDAAIPGQSKSRTVLQKECRVRSYEVIQRSKAWGELIEKHFSNAVRLSIHPQTCGAKKLGIRLLEPDNWMTPWHGVAVKEGERFHLLKRSNAEALGAKLIWQDGRPSHYVLNFENQHSYSNGARDDA
jgi:pyoverdine/dityrosine biosynthesis protein Dit1